MKTSSRKFNGELRITGLLLALVCLAAHSSSAQTFDPSLSPFIRIVSPANHAVFYSPVDVPIFAYTREPYVTNLDFFADGTELGSGTSLGSTNQSGYPFAGPIYRLSSLYGFVWTNAPTGSHSLTVVSKSFNPFTFTSVSRTSAPVNITVSASTTGTNTTDVVSIVAVDPIAISGTNSGWAWAGGTNIATGWTNWPPPQWRSFTNWGPKVAMFAVRRFGDASSELKIDLQIGGTASNGVDYASISNSINMPAGSADVLIPIVPIDNGSNDSSKTVVLTLLPYTNTPSDYIVGKPSRAEAVILYNNWPRFNAQALLDGTFHLNASGPDGGWFAVQSSADLQNWFPVGTNQVVQGSVDFIDPDAPNNPMQFYRVIPLDSGAPQ